MAINQQQQDNPNYAYPPEELLGKILEHLPETVKKMNEMFDIQDEPIQNGIKHLRDTGKIGKLATKEYTTSLVAVDGAMIVERMANCSVAR